jgi:hypothetical protein
MPFVEKIVVVGILAVLALAVFGGALTSLNVGSTSGQLAWDRVSSTELATSSGAAVSGSPWQYVEAALTGFFGSSEDTRPGWGIFAATIAGLVSVVGAILIFKLAVRLIGG